MNLIQKDFSKSLKPFLVMAEKLGMTEENFLAQVESLQERGFLTRIGPFFNMDRTSGHVSLVAMKVPELRFEDINRIVNSFEEVAHNYERNNEFNMWFVVSGMSREDVKNTLEMIENLTGLKTYNFPKLKEYVLDLYLEV